MYPGRWVVRVDKLARSLWKKMRGMPEEEIIRQTIIKLCTVVIDEVLHAEILEYSSDHPRVIEILDTPNTVKYKSEILALISKLSEKYDLEVKGNRISSSREKNSQLGLAGLYWELLVLHLEEGEDFRVYRDPEEIEVLKRIVKDVLSEV